MSGPFPLPRVPSDPAMDGPHRTSPASGFGRTIWFCGVVAVVIGTFLPWFRSGRILRNSYQLAGVGVRRLQAPGWVEALLAGWPFLGALWALAVVLLLAGRVRAAGLLSIGLGVLTGLAALGGLYLSIRLDSSWLGGAAAGPAVTLIGAIAAVTTSYSVLRGRHHRTTSATNPPPGYVG